MNIGRYKHAFFLGGLALLAIAGLVFDRPAYTRGVSYHGADGIVLNDGTFIRSEERLIIGINGVVSLAAMERTGADINYASLAAEVTDYSPRALNIRLQKAQTTRTRPLEALSAAPDILFGRQYGLASGATLRMEFLPVPDRNVICYYAREIDLVRCLNR